MQPTIRIRPATADDVNVIVEILISSKTESFPDLIDEHDRDEVFWRERWRGYITKGSRAQHSRGDGWVFLAESDGAPAGFAAYHHTTRHGTDAELQSIYVRKEWQGQGIGSALLAVVAHRLRADGSRTMCVGFDATSPYKRFYFKHGATVVGSDEAWAIWRDVPALATQLPKPSPGLLDLAQGKRSWFSRLRLLTSGILRS